MKRLGDSLGRDVTTQTTSARTLCTRVRCANREVERVRRRIVYGLLIAFVISATPGAAYCVRHEVAPVAQPGAGDDDQPGKDGDVEQPFATVSPLPDSAADEGEQTGQESSARQSDQNVLAEFMDKLLQVWLLLRCQ